MVSNHSTHTVSRTLKPARLPRACMSQNPIGARLCDPRSMFIRSTPPAWTDTCQMNGRTMSIRWKNHCGKRWMMGRMSRRYLSRASASDRASEFASRCRQLGIVGVTLHSYRYAWGTIPRRYIMPTRNTQKSPCRRWTIGKTTGMRINKAACNPIWRLWILGPSCKPSREQTDIDAVAAGSLQVHQINWHTVFRF
jgi:hypothetical protein